MEYKEKVFSFTGTYTLEFNNVEFDPRFEIMLSAWHNYQKSKEQAKKMLYLPIWRGKHGMDQR